MAQENLMCADCTILVESGHVVKRFFLYTRIMWTHVIFKLSRQTL